MMKDLVTRIEELKRRGLNNQEIYEMLVLELMRESEVKNE